MCVYIQARFNGKPQKNEKLMNPFTHLDSGFLTILQDYEGIGGLEVMDRSSHFIPVDPWPRIVVVNVGDMAKVRLYFLKHIIFISCDQLRRESEAEGVKRYAGGGSHRTTTQTEPLNHV